MTCPWVSRTSGAWTIAPSTFTRTTAQQQEHSHTRIPRGSVLTALSVWCASQRAQSGSGVGIRPRRRLGVCADSIAPARRSVPREYRMAPIARLIVATVVAVAAHRFDAQDRIRAFPERHHDVQAIDMHAREGVIDVALRRPLGTQIRLRAQPRHRGEPIVVVDDHAAHLTRPDRVDSAAALGGDPPPPSACRSPCSS
jgi:hypothetical protein